VTVESGAIIFSFEDGDRHRCPLETGLFGPHDTMTMWFLIDGVKMYWRDNDPLVFADLCHRAAAPATGRRAARLQTAAQEVPSSRFKLPYLRSAPTIQSSPAVAAPQPKAARRRRRSEHEHSWVASHVPGGIVRRVCETCRQVSIDLTEPAEPPNDNGSAEMPAMRSSAEDPWSDVEQV